jgi:hypothetical protein
LSLQLLEGHSGTLAQAAVLAPDEVMVGRDRGFLLRGRLWMLSDVRTELFQFVLAVEDTA